MKNNFIKLKFSRLESLSVVEKEKLLKKLRNKVDFFDRMLVRILNQRTKSAVMIGRIKTSLDQPTYNPERERQVIGKINQNNQGPLTEEAIYRIYERVLDQSRAIQNAESHKLIRNSDTPKSEDIKPV
ncbi:MAG: chorismate mutase [Ignavibacteria bacterium]